MLNEYTLVSVLLPQYANNQAGQQLRKEGNTQRELFHKVVDEGTSSIPPDTKIKDTRSEAHRHKQA